MLASGTGNECGSGVGLIQTGECGKAGENIMRVCACVSQGKGELHAREWKCR